jgi:hypothetical protein
MLIVLQKVPVNGPKMAKALAASGSVPSGGEAVDDANGSGRRDKRKAETETKVKKRNKLLDTDVRDIL